MEWKSRWNVCQRFGRLVTMMLLEGSFAVLSLGFLFEDMGYPYES